MGIQERGLLNSKLSLAEWPQARLPTDAAQPPEQARSFHCSPSKWKPQCCRSPAESKQKAMAPGPRGPGPSLGQPSGRWLQPEQIPAWTSVGPLREEPAASAPTPPAQIRGNAVCLLLRSANGQERAGWAPGDRALVLALLQTPWRDKANPPCASLSPSEQQTGHISYFLRPLPSTESLILECGTRWSAEKGRRMEPVSGARAGKAGRVY